MIPTLVSIGDQVQIGTYQVHSRFKRVVNFISSSTMVSVVTEAIAAGPDNIVVSGLSLSRINSLMVTNNQVAIDDLVFNYDSCGIYNSTISSIKFTFIDFERLHENIKWFEQFLLELAHPLSVVGLLGINEKFGAGRFNSKFEKAFANRMIEGIAKIADGNIVDGVKSIRGLGFGLTPSGDDFITGVLVGINFLQHIYQNQTGCYDLIDKIYNQAIGENVFSNLFLYNAKRGLVVEHVKQLLSNLLNGGKPEIFASVKLMLAVGESSGADFGAGLLFILRNYLTGGVELENRGE